MQELILYTIVILLGSLSLAAFFAVLGALFPNVVARTHTTLEAMPGRAFLVGVVNFIFFAAVGFAFLALSEWSGAQVFSLPALLVVSLLTIGVSFGLAGVVQLVGAQLYAEKKAAPRTVWSTFSLAFACLLPFVGWFGLLPFLGLLGLGAFILSIFRRIRPESKVESGNEDIMGA